MSTAQFALVRPLDFDVVGRGVWAIAGMKSAISAAGLAIAVAPTVGAIEICVGEVWRGERALPFR